MSRTGVEVVREWAVAVAQTRIMATMKDGRRDQPMCSWDCMTPCLAYGAYLRGLIEMDRDWFYWYKDQLPKPHIPDNTWSPLENESITAAIAAWKKTVGANK